MTLTRLCLNNFRNFEKQELSFHPQFNFIFGNNAQGKTNLIEAVCYVSELKSFRTASKDDLIAKKSGLACVEANVLRDELDWNIKVTITPEDRTIEVNGKAPPKRRDYFSLLPLVLFEPRHIYLFRDSPGERRRYLNRALFLMDPGFLSTLNQYDKVLSQKNRILKDGFDLDQLDIWNEKLAGLGSEITLHREQWFSDINGLLVQEYRAISGGHEEFRLDYQPSIPSCHPVTGSSAISTDAHDLLTSRFTKQILESLNTHRHEEIARREAFLGPHRDDFKARLGDRDLGKLGSQGENRSAIIALKMAQLKLFSKKFGKMPLFLLDDVASELDSTRRQHLFSYLRDEAAQVFVTTTENEIISDDYKAKSRSFLVEAGTVSVLV